MLEKYYDSMYWHFFRLIQAAQIQDGPISYMNLVEDVAALILLIM